MLKTVLKIGDLLFTSDKSSIFFAFAKLVHDAMAIIISFFENNFFLWRIKQNLR